YYPPAPPPSIVDEADSPEAEPAYQTECYVRVKNDTKQKLTVFLQYRTTTEAREFAWLPADPETSQQALVWKLEPGEGMALKGAAGAISASRVRVWAVAADGSSWLDNKDEDLWLVPLQDDDFYYYYAPEKDSYTVTFSE